MLLDRIGIYGWEEIEPLILSAILSDLSLLLIGDIGSNKTEGSRLISKCFKNVPSSHSCIDFINSIIGIMGCIKEKS